jgi:hypothetical protein
MGQQIFPGEKTGGSANDRTESENQRLKVDSQGRCKAVPIMPVWARSSQQASEGGN